MAIREYYRDVRARISKRSVESTVSILGISDKALRQHLVAELSKRNSGNGFLSDPVFESMFSWEPSDVTMDDLAGNLLLPSLVDAMDKAGEHRFERSWHPFKHQKTAWKTLLEPPHKSLVVTSGTGSGKTECFMVPILNDLAAEYEQADRPLVGIRALFLYPLNALINSQRERFRAWTDDYNDGLRFCLYNGNTEENRHSDQGQYPNEVLTRKALRDQPAPMLMTNATMLEYMLVRQIDEPIIKQSCGKLRWIVLDEVHTYMGSQAAELSLLLRRVMHTFGVCASDVRFIATSATMGNDPQADSQLQQYLANLAGISGDQVVVVGGRRAIPSLAGCALQNEPIEEIAVIEAASENSDERYRALCESSVARKIRSSLTQSAVPRTLSDLSMAVFNDVHKTEETLKWLDVCSSTIGSLAKGTKSNPFLPVRGHLFHQVLSGLWCCVNKHCHAKSDTSLKDGWPFGNVYTQRKSHCQCSAPVYELIFCSDCNTPHLLAVEHSGSFVQMEREALDEFSLDYENPEESDPNDDINSSEDQVIIAPAPHPELTYSVSINEGRNQVPPGMDTFDIDVIQPTDQACSHCDYTGHKGPFYRRSLLGTPFYISNAIPTLLEASQESDAASERPNRGRRLITFTDSRQGTARISTKIQQDSERDSIRGLTYASVANNVTLIGADKTAEKEAKLKSYRESIEKFREKGEDDLVKGIEDLAEKIQLELDSQGTAKPLSWRDAIARFHSSLDISRWIFDYYREINPQLFVEGEGPVILVEMLLLREFARRPKRQNSMETLGLVSVQYPALQEIVTLPGICQELELSIDDWRAFLKITLDFYIRENSIIDIPDDWVNWMGAKIYAKSVLKPGSDENIGSRLLRWPQVRQGRNSRLIRLLAAALNLDITNAADKDAVNDILKESWGALTRRYPMVNADTGQQEERQILKNIAGSLHFQLDRREIAFQACQDLWICPVTHRLLDTTFRDLTPYLPFKYVNEEIKCRKTSSAICRVDASTCNSDEARVRHIRQWIDQQSAVQALRDENLWTDVSDRIVEGGRFYRAAEHSAQQPASILSKYERLFKSGRLNVLSCSTTMEMGVDIGGISVVAMNNVPPHPANYLQRTGRAGRRGETQALAFTICKDNPHERAVFSNPVWPFTTAIPAPHISLNNERIIQRHINALLMSCFLKEVAAVGETAVTSLNCQWFFSAEDDSEAPVDRMLRWLESCYLGSVPESLGKGITSIIHGSILAAHPIEHIIKKSVASLTRSKQQWLPAFNKIKSQAASVSSLGETDPLRKKVEYDLRCMGEQFLLSELASKAFLPGYGFPTGIVTFDHYSVSDFKQGMYRRPNGRIDNQTRMRERPGRQMAIAIREYAPGADVVLNGLVYKSSGILLNKFSPNEDYSQPQMMMKEWRCDGCGFIGNESGATFNAACSECGRGLKEKNIREYIDPVGFAVDFYSTPSTDISSQAYVPVEEPWVTANAPISPLFDPRLGAARVSSEGHIFHHSSGENGTGFAVCLRCGRSESMTQNNNYPTTLQPGQTHSKLQGKLGPDSLPTCAGSDEAYAIKAGVHLGTTDQTDVFELYLKNPAEGSYLRHKTGDQLPWTLAVVFRQVLADIHGVNAEEMGYTVKASKIPDCNYPEGAAGIVLFDTHGGGSGFASSASRHLRDMLLKAREYLACKDNCESACQRCLLGYDTRFHAEVLNRHVALEYLQSIENYLDLPPEAKIFGDSTEHCFESLSEEILAATNHGCKNLRLYLAGPYPGWDISSSDLKEVCLRWQKSLDEVCLILSDTNLNGLSDVHKEDLRALNNLGVRICALKGDESVINGSATLLAQLEGESATYTFGTNATDANIPGSDWLKMERDYLLKSKAVSVLSIGDIDKNLLFDQSVAGDVEIEIMGQCDGLVRKFGGKLWNELKTGSHLLADAMDSKPELKALSYSDPYICSPWNLMLLAEVIDGLKKNQAEKWSNPSIVLLTSDKPPNPKFRGMYAEWSNASEKSSVITEYFNQMGENITVDIKPNHDLAHGRVLTLIWTDGAQFTVRFDHGFGCWSIDGKTSKWFDIKGTPKDQISDMYSILRDLKVRFGKKFATQIFVKKKS